MPVKIFKSISVTKIPSGDRIKVVASAVGTPCHGELAAGLPPRAAGPQTMSQMLQLVPLAAAVAGLKMMTMNRVLQAVLKAEDLSSMMPARKPHQPPLRGAVPLRQAVPLLQTLSSLGR